MSGKFQFLDTNILVYAYSDDDPQKREVARSLISSEEVMISTSFDVVWKPHPTETKNLENSQRMVWFGDEPMALSTGLLYDDIEK